MRKWLSKTLAVGLTFAMTAVLAACGGESDGSIGNGGKSAANAQLAKENVYTLEEFDFPKLVDMESGYINIYSTQYLDGKVYMVVETNDWTKEMENPDISLVVINEDGSGLEVTKLDTSNGEDGDGDEGTGEDSAAVPEGEDGEGEIDAGGSSDIWEYTGYGNFRISFDGKIYGTKNYNYENYGNPEQPVSESHVYVCCWDVDGSRIWETELEGLRSKEEGAEWIYISDLILAKDGGMEILLSGENMYRMSVSSDGTLSEREQLSEETSKVLATRMNSLEREDGTMLVMYSDENDWTKSYMVSYDLAADSLGEPTTMPASFTWSGYNAMTVGKNSDLVFAMTDGIYIYNQGDESATKKMDFVNSDVNISNFMGLVQLDENRFMGVYNENYGEDVKGAIFTYRDPKDIPDKSVVVLAGNWLGSELRQRVVEFNRSNDTYRIVLKEYDSYNSYDDYEAGFTKLNNDIITGSMPDILVANNLPIDNYIAKGLVADVGELIEQDPELSQVEFLQNVFDAFSVDDKLYYVVPRFSVSTMIAKTALVGDRDTWNLEDMKQVVETMGENAQPIGEMSRYDFMSTAMQYCGNDFIDVKTGKCSFNSQNFINMMEYAKTLPEEIDWDSVYGKDDYWMTQESQYRDNKTLLMRLSIGELRNLNYQLNGYFGEPVTFIGFPTESGKGSFIIANQSYVLSAKSANLEGAWEFVRYYLMDEYQNGEDWGLPVNKQSFMERAQLATQKPTYTDENGNEVEYEDTFYVNGEEIPLAPLSQEQVDQVVEFILSVDRAYYYNEKVFNIINEEIGGFFAGQRSAKDVADVIQSRAQVYVDENR